MVGGKMDWVWRILAFHSFSKYLLSPYCGSGPVGDGSVKEID